MRIKESKNLKHDKTAKVLFDPGDYDKLDLQPRVCVLDTFERLNDTFVLHFKNSAQAVIKARNNEGSLEIDLIGNKLAEYIGRSYEEILDIEIV